MWRINLVKNELDLTPEAAAEISAFPAHFGTGVRSGKLHFDPSHFEHMDYVWKDEVIAVIAKHKLTGEILFSSSEGDNRNTGWGYRFEDGVLTKLTRNAARDYVPNGDPSLSEESTEINGVEVEDLAEAKVGDFVGVGFVFMGLTSWEREQIGDVLPDGTLVVEGREFSAPTYRFRNHDASFVLKTLNDPAVELEDD